LSAQCAIATAVHHPTIADSRVFNTEEGWSSERRRVRCSGGRVYRASNGAICDGYCL